MTGRQSHIIRRQVLNVRSTGDADGMQLQRETEQLYRGHVLPGLEALLDRYGAGENIIPIDKLQVSLEGIDRNGIDTELARRILAEIEKALQAAVVQPAAAVPGVEQDEADMSPGQTPEAHFMQTWVYYLQHGYLPWWSDITDAVSWLQRLNLFVQQAPVALLQTVKTYLQDEQVAARIAIQLNDISFRVFFMHITGWDEALLQWLFADEQVIESGVSQYVPRAHFRSMFRRLLLAAVVQPYAEQVQLGLFTRKLITALRKKSPEALHQVKYMTLQTKALSDSVAHAFDELPDVLEAFLPEIKEQQEETIPDRQQAEDGIYINNAGLVLIAPYLSSFFPRMDLVADNKITNPGKAVALLQYLVSGTDEYAEFETVLSKILCGLEPEIFVPAIYRLIEEDKQLADELLAAVISHWTVLKNTTADGLRNSFLCREGKLELNNNTWHLRVQEHSFDVLLDHLPWSISMIRLPWMQQLLQVSWR